MKLVDAVLDAARCGLSVLPWQYENGSKKPMMRWKDLQQRPLSPAQVEDWWRSNPDHNWGAITGSLSNLVVIDLDDKEASTWARDTLPPTEWLVSTGRGEHWGYRHPGGTVKNRVKIGGMNIDLRGDGGWVAMPPSRHKNGHLYEWMSFRGSMPFPDELPIFDPSWLPAPVVRELPAAAPAGSVIASDAFRRASAWLRKRAPAVEGNAGDTWTYITCAQMVRDFGLGEHDAYEALMDWNMSCMPPWDEKTLRQKIRNAMQYGTAAKGSAPDTRASSRVSFEYEPVVKEKLSLYEDNDIGNGERFAGSHAKCTKYCHELNCWYYWDGKRWCEDKVGHAMALAKETARDIANEVSLLSDSEDIKAKNKWSLRSRSASSIKNMLTMAQCEGDVPVLAEEFDSDIWILNTPSGVIDLRTGAVSSHDPDKLCTKMTISGADSSVATPNFDKFMEQTFRGDPELIKYAMQALGFSLTGSVREHVFFFCYGTGANGKGTLLNLMMELMGDYAAATPEGLLMSRQNDKHLAELIMLKGLRMAVGAETQEDRRLNEARMKNLTGGDPITADPKGGAYVTFKPTHTLWLSGNHKPRIKGVDNGVWRRTRLIPFNNVMSDEDQDKGLDKKLWAEREGILAKLVDAAVSWCRDGFIKCDAVEKATANYRNEEDSFGVFIDDSCVVHGEAMCAKSSMRKAYVDWVRMSGGKELSERSMNERLRRIGFDERRVGNIRHWLGVGVQSEEVIH